MIALLVSAEHLALKQLSLLILVRLRRSHPVLKPYLGLVGRRRVAS